MSKIDELRRIIDECDETLKAAFLRRLDSANQIAQVKLEEGRKIYDPDRKSVVQGKSGKISVNIVGWRTDEKKKKRDENE